MPGQALIEFLRSGCRRGADVLNALSDFAHLHPESSSAIPNQAQHLVLMVLVST